MIPLAPPGLVYDCMTWEQDGALWASGDPGCRPGSAQVLLGPEEKAALRACLLSVHQGTGLAELPGPFQLGHSNTPWKRMSNGQFWVGPITSALHRPWVGRAAGVRGNVPGLV